MILMPVKYYEVHKVVFTRPVHSSELNVNPDLRTPGKILDVRPLGL